MVLVVSGACGRCGNCCKKPSVAAPYMLDGDACKYLYYKGKKHYCEFKEGRIDPSEALNYYQKVCIPYPRVRDIEKVDVPTCTYILVEVQT